MVGYIIIATDAPNRHRGGLALFYRNKPWFSVEAIQIFFHKVISFHLDTGWRKCYIVGLYLAPDNASTTERGVAAVGDRPRGSKLLVAGNFNADLAGLEGSEWDKEIMEALVEAGLEDMLAHFLLC